MSSKENLGPKKFGFEKNFGFKKKFSLKKILGSKQILYLKIFKVQNEFWASQDRLVRVGQLGQLGQVSKVRLVMFGQFVQVSLVRLVQLGQLCQQRGSLDEREPNTMQIRLHLNPEGWRGWVAGLGGGWLGIATIQLSQPS